MASCHTPATTVALDKVIERALYDNRVACSVGETERVRSLRSTRISRGELRAGLV
jgi:hypothetical protein